MKLILGLGNVGEKYEKTRHNFGFLAVEKLAKDCGFPEFKMEKKFFAKISYGELNNEKCILVKPETFMNLSGKSAQAIVNFYKIPISNIVVIFDDIDLPFGIIRERNKGGSGGHNGIKSIIENLSSPNFGRLKLGISNEFREKTETDKFVLSKFSQDEITKIPQILNNLKSYL